MFNPQKHFQAAQAQAQETGQAGSSQDSGLMQTMLSRAEKIGPPTLPPVVEAGVPSPRSGLWQTLNVGRQGLPEFQELMKYLPLTPEARTGSFSSVSTLPGNLYQTLLKRFSGKGPQ